MSSGGVWSSAAIAPIFPAVAYAGAREGSLPQCCIDNHRDKTLDYVNGPMSDQQQQQTPQRQDTQTTLLTDHDNKLT